MHVQSFLGAGNDRRFTYTVDIDKVVRRYPSGPTLKQIRFTALYELNGGNSDAETREYTQQLHNIIVLQDTDE